ncbi:hypothetical protein ABE504_11300 [Paenibacillus oryzisoli]|uniref:hypothetical protein n=1 Tax=Paenibacillus oryzisoli TaxID=1850517 RepID=UPI003D275C17
MFVVCLLIFSGIGLYATLKPPTELHDQLSKRDMFPEIKMERVQQVFVSASFKKED